VVPHITDAIQEWVERVAKVSVDGDNKPPEVCIVEVCWILCQKSEMLISKPPYTLGVYIRSTV